jgi:riboflavin biosynthesis pyrimidine reductase
MKPHVICHMVASIDGRTVLNRWRPEGVVPDGLFERLYNELNVNAWLIGRTTGQEFAEGKPYSTHASERVPREAWFARRDAKGYGIVLDPHGKLAWGRSSVQDDHVVVVLTEEVSDSHLAGLRADGVSYCFAGRSSLNLARALEAIARELSVKRLLLQGGGMTNGAFLQAGLIDEISLVLFPAVDGTNVAPSIFESGDGEPNQAPPLRSITLDSQRNLEGGAVWLRYSVRQA